MDDDQESPFQASSPVPVYAQLANELQRQIESGELPAGARLPGERELARTYHVALGTTRRAIQELRERGLVVTQGPLQDRFLSGFIR
ncbi:GntR family transcriptional regulator [Streptomyces sp. 8L]|uniref:GntR family transcriptional regulator n=1 Tax=Streptomyces sp. 8L TaxID=2877242 RepID=UPI001CD2E767|nr:winged helix-turn-helix domain-containing protein [Streptomyces sp. 8L]MCA1224375.1 winged helix-turn-helix domain-containing protein [Streptomyces sp. 8L]